MYLIVGLGNPGAKYAHTRHNVGFDVVDTLARKLGVTIGRERDEALLGECFIAGQKTILALPQTYMNLSGEAVSRLVRWYRLPPENLMVVYDDVDLWAAVLNSGTTCFDTRGQSGFYDQTTLESSNLFRNLIGGMSLNANLIDDEKVEIDEIFDHF